MCGIAGVINFQAQLIKESLIEEMIHTLNYRGPDDYGLWCDGNIGLGHSRLSIHDLSTAGHQPMFSFNGEWVIVFNGEIYNYKALRDELIKSFDIKFISDTDTEVLVNAIECLGVEKSLQKCIGMFAFCAYNRKTRNTYLARDRFGEKPLYYGFQNNTLGFASELKALKALREIGWKFEVDRDVLASYLRYGYVPTPWCIYKNMHKLEPGTFLKITSLGEKKYKSYWEAKESLEQNKFTGSYNEAVETLEQKLKNTLTMQMDSDVPLGAFLSGGVDSSVITTDTSC